MRQRKIKNLEEKLQQFSHLVVKEPKENKGKWRSLFEDCSQLYVEIGCGKGKFIASLAAQRPDGAFIGIEGQQTVIYRALEKIQANNLSNVLTIDQYVDPEDLDQIFAPDEVDGVYLNFSDPWPKERHEKRRLTYGKRLLAYCKLIKDCGFIQFKTDNEDLFEYSLEQIQKENLEIIKMTRDLHGSDLEEKNITTEYEDKFKDKGKNINMVTIRVNK